MISTDRLFDKERQHMLHIVSPFLTVWTLDIILGYFQVPT